MRRKRPPSPCTRRQLTRAARQNRALAKALHGPVANLPPPIPIEEQLAYERDRANRLEREVLRLANIRMNAQTLRELANLIGEAVERFGHWKRWGS